MGRDAAGDLNCLTRDMIVAGINRDFFYSQVRKTLFFSGIRQPQVDGMNAILNEWDGHHADQDDRWLAYMLATTYHETDQKMQPIEEYGKGKGRPYGIPDLATGQTYYGRGFVQLTWKNNYATLGREIGVDLVDSPALALTLVDAAKIMFSGMIKGLFTGKALIAYFDAARDDWVGARRIINGQDKAQAIAGYGHNFYAGLSYRT